MIQHIAIDDRTLRSIIRRGKITFAGNKKLKIYGTLHCRSGRRMKRDNRVFFATEREAILLGYRRCKLCERFDVSFSWFRSQQFRQSEKSDKSE